MTRDEAKQYFERYAYQTRHGSDLGADMVLDEAMIEIARVRSEALADAAKAADMVAEQYWDFQREEEGSSALGNIANEVAARIRALAPKGAAGR